MFGTWLLLLAPAAIYSQWFSLDMGGMWTRALDFPQNLKWAFSPEALGGRFFPAYWFYIFGLFRLLGTNIPAQFIVQIALFLVSLAITCRLLWQLTGDRVATVVFGVLACLGGAVAENMYTLGKAEWLAYLFLTLALACFHQPSGTRRPSGVRLALIALLVVLAIWSKETSLVVLAFAPGAALVAAIAMPRPWRDLLREPVVARYGWFLAAVLVGLALARAPYLFAGHGGDSSYVDYTIDAELLTDNLLFYISQQPDVLVLALAGSWLIVRAALRVRAQHRQGLDASCGNLMFAGGLLAMAWGYCAGLVIWRWPMGYYMLLPSIFFKLIAVYGFWLALSDGLRSRAVRCGWIILVIAIVYGLLHSFYVATSQLAYSRMYTEAIHRYMTVARPDERLIIESFPFYSEATTNTRQVIALMTGEQRVVTGIADLVDPAVNTPGLMKLLHITPQQIDDNEKSLPRRGDYLLVMTGNKLATWFVRGAAPYFSVDSLLLRQGEFDMVPVAEDRSFVTSLFMNIWTHHVQLVPTYVGYKLYRVTSDRPRLLWRGRYPDTWIGKSASVRLYPEFGRRALFTVSTPDFNSPNRLTVIQDGEIVRRMTLIAGHEESFELENSGQHVPTRIEFEVQRTSVPKKLKLNDDKREIGIFVRIEAPDAQERTNR